jgi:hypothetical protein
MRGGRGARTPSTVPLPRTMVDITGQDAFRRTTYADFDWFDLDHDPP